LLRSLLGEIGLAGFCNFASLVAGGCIMICGWGLLEGICDFGDYCVIPEGRLQVKNKPGIFPLRSKLRAFLRFRLQNGSNSKVVEEEIKIDFCGNQKSIHARIIQLTC
jgi:hypothetical protein